jgi:hypothetical protein
VPLQLQSLLDSNKPVVRQHIGTKA